MHNCGIIAGPILPSVCPTCDFRDISPCPHCKQEVARQSYLPVSGDLFKCPMCQRLVQLQMHEPLFNGQGVYNQPLVDMRRSTGGNPVHFDNEGHIVVTPGKFTRWP